MALNTAPSFGGNSSTGGMPLAQRVATQRPTRGAAFAPGKFAGGGNAVGYRAAPLKGGPLGFGGPGGGTGNTWGTPPSPMPSMPNNRVQGDPLMSAASPSPGINTGPSMPPMMGMMGKSTPMGNGMGGGMPPPPNPMEQQPQELSGIFGSYPGRQMDPRFRY